MDNCEVADGFIEGRTCTLPYDTKTGAKIHSMQLISEPKWDRTHIVYEKAGTGGPGQGSSVWAIASYMGGTKHVKAYTDSESFYTINARAIMRTADDGRQYICAETHYPKQANENKICHVFKSDNLDIWNSTMGNSSMSENKTIEIIVQASCGNHTNSSEVLIPQECFAPLTEKNGW